jgi:hypothetical protein
MNRQTLRWDRWIVVDDCEPRTVCTLGQMVINPAQIWKPGIDSQRDNLRLALAEVKPGAHIMVIEDDDYYSPAYLAVMSRLLEAVPVAGIAPSRYYHASIRAYHVFNNLRHASLCQTCLRYEELPRLLQALESKLGDFVDMHFWGSVERDGIPRAFIDLPIGIGIKGLPGRPGIVQAHRGIGVKSDPAGARLREWIGADADAYLRDWGNVTRWSKAGVPYVNVEQVAR